MKIIITDDAAKTASAAAAEILDQVKKKPASRLGLATGSTAEAIYAYIVKAYREGKADFSRVSTINLDEYVGLSPAHPQSYRASMNRWLFDQIDIDKRNTIVASGEGDPADSTVRFRSAVRSGGPIDLQLLGVGVNGHIGFNEPGDKLWNSAHMEWLTESTIAMNERFFDSKRNVPKAAITMGMGEILGAKRIVLAAMGGNKANALRELLLHDEISCNIPVSFLKLHTDVTVILDRELARTVGYSKA